MAKPKRASAQATKSQNKEFRAGAIASFTALQAIDKIVDRYRNGVMDSKSYFRDRELVKAIMVDHVRDASPFIHGFVSALAEYIDTFMQDCDGPLLGVWRPESIMTASEVKAERALIFKGEEAVARIASSVEGEVV